MLVFEPFVFILQVPMTRGVEPTRMCESATDGPDTKCEDRHGNTDKNISPQGGSETTNNTNEIFEYLSYELFRSITPQ